MAKQRRLNVLLIGKKSDHVLKLREHLAANENIILRYDETADTAMSHILTGNLNAIIFALEWLGAAQCKLVQEIKNTSKVFQLVVITDGADPDAVAEAKKITGVAVIERALFDLDRDLTGLCERMVGTETPYFRENLRRAANQKAKVEVIETRRHYDALMKDVSEKGACIEIHTGSLKRGDKIRVTIPLDKLGKERIVVAEVRWSKSTPGRGTIGVLFLPETK